MNPVYIRTADTLFFTWVDFTTDNVLQPTPFSSTYSPSQDC